MYPYIPNPDNFYRKVETKFEQLNPEIDLIIRLNADYYDETAGIINEEADIYEIDCILMEDFVAKAKIQPVTNTSFIGKKPVPLSLISISVDKKVYGLPHWVCGNFLFYDKNDAAMSNVSTLKGLENAIGANPTIKTGLLVDLKGKLTLGEMYADGLLDLYAGTPQAFNISVFCTVEKMDTTVVKNMCRLPKLTYSNWGRVDAYHDNAGFYPRQFAKGNGRALVGYSESLYNVVEEANYGCATEEKCFNPANIGVSTFVLADKVSMPVGWTDALALDAKLSGQKLADAENFLTFCVSDDTYKMALIPDYGQAPRYLLPAYRTYYYDAEVLKNAPIYSQLIPIVEKMIPVKGKGMSASLRAIGKKIDKEYLKD
jgi:thiamine pyridinylase